MKATQTHFQIATFLKDELLGFSDFFIRNFFVLLLLPFKHGLPQSQGLYLSLYHRNVWFAVWQSWGGENLRERWKRHFLKQHLTGQKCSQLKTNCFGRLLDFFQSHRGQIRILTFHNDTNLKYYISSDGLNEAFPQTLSLYFLLKIQIVWGYSLMNSRIL